MMFESAPAWIMPDLTATPSLRIGFLALCALFILLSILDGRREGLGRKSFGVIALIGGICVGYFGADFWGALAGKFLPYPPAVLRLFGGIGGFLLFSVGFSLIGMFVFRPTRKVDDPELKRMVGTGGALAGFVLGVLSVLLMLVMIRVVGQFGESFIRGYGPVLEANSLREDSEDVPAEAQLALNSLGWIARLNASLEGLPGDGLIARIDPVPEKTYRVTDKVVRVLSNPVALDTLAQQPQTRRLLDDPLVQELIADEEITTLAEQRDLQGLMSHPKVVALAHDGQFSQLLEEYELEAELDKALNAPAQAPGSFPAPGQAGQNATPQVIIIEPVEGS